MSTYRFRIIEDDDYDPATSVDWSDEDTAAYVARFQSGELAAFGIVVEVERPFACCDVCGQGATWENGASLWGIDVVTYGPERDTMLDLGEGWHTVGEVDLPAEVSDENPSGSYLAYVLADLLRESEA